MREFEKILKMNQKELKAFLKGYLEENNYTVVDEDGFLYAKGKVPVLLVAHMDRYPESHLDSLEYSPRSERVLAIQKKPVDDKTWWSSPQGIGGDDRCGIWSIMQLIRKHHASVLFTEWEEIGCIGAKKFCWTDYVHDLDVNYMIEIDRRGSNDAVFYCCGNDEFQQYILGTTNYKIENGTSTDIRYIMSVSNIAGVNFSCGYYNEHCAKEHVVIEEMRDTQETIDRLLEHSSQNVEGVFAACVSDADYKDIQSKLELYRPRK